MLDFVYLLFHLVETLYMLFHFNWTFFIKHFLTSIIWCNLTLNFQIHTKLKRWVFIYRMRKFVLIPYFLLWLLGKLVIKRVQFSRFKLLLQNLINSLKTLINRLQLAFKFIFDYTLFPNWINVVVFQRFLLPKFTVLFQFIILTRKQLLAKILLKKFNSINFSLVTFCSAYIGVSVFYIW